jgi:tRNA(fMet)-specific endonuclease VapC
MLDTNTVSFALRGQGEVAERIRQHRPSELCMSAITVAELRYGADKRGSRRLHELIDTLTASLLPVDFDIAAAAHFGRLASALARRGAPIGDFDTLIAAHAMSLSMTLVTNNAKHFGRVAGLACEDWL